jgi:hypothetical protein
LTLAGVLEGFVLGLAGGAAETVGERVIDLKAPGMYFVPITPEFRQRSELSPEAATKFGDFYELTQGLAKWAQLRSKRGPVLYIHVEFHGGEGFHAAIGWRDGEVAFGPCFTETAHELEGEPFEVAEVANMAVNRGLRALGMAHADDSDEFRAVGLDLHRWSEDWLAQERD